MSKTGTVPVPREGHDQPGDSCWAEPCPQGGMSYLKQKAMFQTVLGRAPASWRLEKTLQKPSIGRERSIINLVFPLNNIGLAHGDLCQ